MKKTGLIAAVWFGWFMGAAGAHAHDDAYLDTVKAPNGGQLRMAGGYHYELVVVKDSKTVSDSPVVVYVTDHAGRKIPTAGATGTAILLSGKVKTTAVLVPDGDNRMKGRARYASTPGMKGVISIALPGEPAEQARFTPLAVAQDEHMHPTH